MWVTYATKLIQEEGKLITKITSRLNSISVIGLHLAIRCVTGDKTSIALRDLHESLEIYRRGS